MLSLTCGLYPQHLGLPSCLTAVFLPTVCLTSMLTHMPWSFSVAPPSASFKQLMWFYCLLPWKVFYSILIRLPFSFCLSLFLNYFINETKTPPKGSLILCISSLAATLLKNMTSSPPVTILWQKPWRWGLLMVPLLSLSNFYHCDFHCR